jgi:hypothetical protein
MSLITGHTTQQLQFWLPPEAYEPLIRQVFQLLSWECVALYSSQLNLSAEHSNGPYIAFDCTTCNKELHLFLLEVITIQGANKEFQLEHLHAPSNQNSSLVHLPRFFYLLPCSLSPSEIFNFAVSDLCTCVIKSSMWLLAHGRVSMTPLNTLFVV